MHKVITRDEQGITIKNRTYIGWFPSANLAMAKCAEINKALGVAVAFRYEQQGAWHVILLIS